MKPSTFSTPATILPGVSLSLGILTLIIGALSFLSPSPAFGASLISLSISIIAPALYSLHQVRHWRKNTDLDGDNLAGDLLPASPAQLMLIRNGFRSLGYFYEPTDNTKLTRALARELLDEIYDQQDATNGKVSTITSDIAGNSHSYWWLLLLTPIGVGLCFALLADGSMDTSEFFIFIGALSMIPGGIIGAIAARGQRFRADLDHDGLASDLSPASIEQVELLANGYRLLGQSYTRPTKTPSLSAIRQELRQINHYLAMQYDDQR